MDRYFQIIEFLSRLRQNNHKEWFDAHRSEYKQVRSVYEAFVGEMIISLGQIDPEVGSLQVKECTYRINRDTRFSADKTPYKTHLGTYIAPKGKKSGYAGYYIHFEPEGHGSTSFMPNGGSMLASGIYRPEPTILRSVREEILDNGEHIQQTIDSASEYQLSVASDTLKRTPRGFPSDTPYDHLLRLKHLMLERSLPTAYFQSQDSLVEKLTESFRPTVALVQTINRAVTYAYEEMI